MDKLKYFLLLDPIQSLDNSSHNSDIDWFVTNFLAEQSIKFERGLALKESGLLLKVAFKMVTVLKLVAIGLANAFKAKKLARKYDVTVFNPNDDPISLIILQKIRNLSKSDFKIKSRFIGTRDRVLIKKDSLLVNGLKRRISASIRHQDRVSAETKSYSEFLSEEFRFDVDFVPYPPIDLKFNAVSTRRENDLYVALGAARKDKGFETLVAWIDLIFQNNPSANFVIQEASKPWEGYEDALRKLSERKNVRILPSFIDAVSQHEILTLAFAVMAPYDLAIYQFRGSAFTRRAMYLGKLVCTTPGTSMSKDAENYDLLIFPSAPFNEHKTLQSHQIRHGRGVNLQKDSIRAWTDFLL
jgi:hypothetical protein